MGKKLIVFVFILAALFINGHIVSAGTFTIEQTVLDPSGASGVSGMSVWGAYSIPTCNFCYGTFYTGVVFGPTTTDSSGKFTLTGSDYDLQNCYMTENPSRPCQRWLSWGPVTIYGWKRVSPNWYLYFAENMVATEGTRNSCGPVNSYWYWYSPSQ